MLVAEAHRRVRDAIRPGVTTAEVDMVVDDLFRDRQAIPLFKGVPGEVPFPAATCISVNEQVVHGIPGPRVLQEGDIASVDTGCMLEGWCGDAAATYPVGQICDESKELLDVTKSVLNLAITLLGEKSLWSQVASEMQTYVRDHGFSVVEDFVGHGIGRAMHEAPQVPNFVTESFLSEGDFELRTGLVLAIEPMVNIGRKEVRKLEDHWTLVTEDGSRSAHFEHTVAITSDGPLVLTECSDRAEANAP